jgi:hypothetical protein
VESGGRCEERRGAGNEQNLPNVDVRCVFNGRVHRLKFSEGKTINAADSVQRVARFHGIASIAGWCGSGSG